MATKNKVRKEKQERVTAIHQILESMGGIVQDKGLELSRPHLARVMEDLLFANIRLHDSVRRIK